MIDLNQVRHRLEHIDSLIHCLWMATGSITDKPERDALRDLAHHAGETLSEIIADLPEDKAPEPVQMTGRRG